MTTKRVSILALLGFLIWSSNSAVILAAFQRQSVVKTQQEIDFTNRVHSNYFLKVTSGTNPAFSDVSHYAEEIAQTYGVPSLIVKAILFQESGWRQLEATGESLISPNHRIGIMQVRVSYLNAQFETIRLAQTRTGRLADELIQVDIERLKTDWRYNLEVGVRVLVQKYHESTPVGTDLKLFTSWNYALALYDGFQQGGINDPENPVYSRRVKNNSDWINSSIYPYQECIYNIATQRYKLPKALRPFFREEEAAALIASNAIAHSTVSSLNPEPTSSLTLGEQNSQSLGFETSALCDSPPTSFYLRFPLLNQTAYSAHINTVFDHYITTGLYNKDDRISTYTGEDGRKAYGLSPDVYGACSCLYGMKNQGRIPFLVNNNYGDVYLYYDGHPGYDYRASCGTSVYAAVSGTVRYPSSIPGISNAFKFHVLELDPDPPNDSYRIYYLHLATHPQWQTNPSCNGRAELVSAGTHVNAGDQIGLVGDAGVSGAPHLHFEVQKNGIPVDPYGWQGQYTDNRGAGVNTNLWKPSAYAACNVRWHPDGTLIKLGSTVWLIEGGQKRLIPNTTVFYAYGYDFANAINITQEEANCFPDGTNLGMPPSPRLINAGGTIYEITDRNKKRAFPSARVFQGLGFNWDVVQSGSISGIADDPNVPVYNTPFRDGTLLQSGGTFYIISNSKKRAFSTASAFQSSGYRFDDAIPVSSTEVTTIPDGGIITDSTITQCLSGGSGNPVIFITPLFHDYGSIPVSSFSDFPFLVQNTGTGTLSGSASVAAPYSIFTGGSYNLSPGQSQFVTVRFSPTAAQSYTQNITFTGGSGTSAQVTGTGTSGGSSQPAQITIPTPGSTLSGSTVTFGWNAGSGVSQYWLYVGTSPAGSDIYNANQGTNRSATVSNIPTDGRTIYVRLWSYIGGWQWNDYTYIAASGGGTPIISVTPSSLNFGSVPVGSSSNLNFTVQNVGNGTLSGSASVPAPFSIIAGGTYNLTSGQSQSVTVRFSPTAMQSYSQNVTFAGGGGATRQVTGTGISSGSAPTVSTGSATSITSNSAILNGSVNPNGLATTIFFQWGTTTSYGNQTSSQSMGSGTGFIGVSSSLSGLSPNTTYHCRIVGSNSSGTNFGSNVSFTTSSGGGSGPAQITSPTQGSTLGGSTATFAWTSSSGAGDYWLYVGNSIGGADIYNQEQGLNLSAAVSGIPTDGRTIYVRLWTYIGGWLFNDYTYRAASGGGGSATNRLLNPSFESGPVNWVQFSSAGFANITNSAPTVARTGSWLAWLGGADNLTEYIYQDVPIPANATQANLQFYYKITTNEGASTTCFDRLAVEIRRPGDNALLATLTTKCNYNQTSLWTSSGLLNVLSLRGQTIRLRFIVTTDGSLPTSFFLDDITLVTDGN